MTDLSLAIRNARIVDGTGAPAFSGDLGVVGDRIVAIGVVEDRAAHELDAQGLVLAPGFIDAHTHYDPQLCWDGLAAPTPEHGVTTLVAGNCGLGLAPIHRGRGDKITRLFGVVEDLEPESFAAGVPYDWESVAEYLDGHRGRLGPNVRMLVGHATLRLYVMGAEAQARAATPDETTRMAELLRAALRAGALGLSLSYAHLDDQGLELPSFYAERAEREALCRVLAEEGVGVVQLTPALGRPDSAAGVIDECGEISLATGVSFSVAPIIHNPGQGDFWLRILVRLEAWRARGAKVFGQTQVRPFDVAFRLSHGSLALAKGPTWGRLLALPFDERIAAFRDPGLRPVLDGELQALGRFVNALVVRRSEAGPNQPYLGRKLVDIAAEAGRSLADVLLEIALADELETEFEIAGLIHADPQIVALLLSHPAICIGAGDAGAHVTQFAGVGDTAFLFERYVRELGLFSLEFAVQRLTGDVARMWGMTGRGVLAPGAYADLVVFDPGTVARGPEQRVRDVPGGGERMVRKPSGIKAVIVNGEIVVEDGAYSPARPGRFV